MTRVSVSLSHQKDIQLLLEERKAIMQCLRVMDMAQKNLNHLQSNYVKNGAPITVPTEGSLGDVISNTSTKWRRFALTYEHVLGRADWPKPLEVESFETKMLPMNGRWLYCILVQFKAAVEKEVPMAIEWYGVLPVVETLDD